jgi:DNA-directed RNA polymerase sigma subunit (sigma70/sigma32)
MKRELPALKKENTQERTDGMTQHEVADVLDLTRSQVDTIEKKALRKLKYIIQKKYEKGDFI